MGMLIVNHLRELCHRTNEVWKLASICYVLPVAVYVILNVTVAYSLCEKLVSDSFSFGILTGICLKLLVQPSGEHTFRVMVRTNKVNQPPCVVWLPGPETSVSAAIAAIGEKLNIVPSSRISVETGRGAFVTEVDKPLLQQLSAAGHPANYSFNAANKDFFGFTTTVCNVLVRDEEVLEEDSEDEEEVVVGKRPANLTNLINSRGPVRWKDDLLLSANVGGADIPFSVGSIDNYAAAAPPPAGYSLDSFWGSSSKEVVHFIPWAAAEEGDDDRSDIAHSEISVATGRESKHSSGGMFGFWKPNKLQPHLHMSAAPLHDGDMIVIANGKGGFMSVRQGWWMGWGSAEPRRSGAFVIEIVERAPQIFTDIRANLPSINSPFSPAKTAAGNALNSANLAASQSQNANASASGGVSAQVSSSGNATVSLHGTGEAAAESKEREAAVLNTGDLFRLRSVKFPEYELGITSKKISGNSDHCYLGLHKAQAFGVEEDENVWCHATRFSARYSTTIRMF